MVFPGFVCKNLKEKLQNLQYLEFIAENCQPIPLKGWIFTFHMKVMAQMAETFCRF